MQICPQCGQKFSGFSFGSKPATECRDCRRAKAQAATLQATVGPGSVAGAPAVANFTPIVTLTLIGLNALVYVAMGLGGVSWTDPSVEHAVRWGADFGPLTLSGEWWRALTSAFVHFGIIHIALNMWCLWSLGVSLERFMGRAAFAVSYVLSGLTASLVSIAWNPWRVSAGASGAIFGVAGAFVSYLFFKKAPIDKVQVRRKLKSLLIFIFYNLLYGAAGNVDNSAHLGGLIAGLILGSLAPAILRRADPVTPVTDSATTFTASPDSPIVFSEITPEQMSRVNRITMQIAVGSLVVLFVAGGWIRSSNVPVTHYGEAIAFVKAGHLDQGIAEMEQAVALNPQLFYAPTLLGEFRLEQGNPTAAVPALEHSMTLAPNVYYVQHNLALAYLGAGRSTDAMRQISSALQSEQEDAWRAQYILALAAAESGNSKVALENLRLVLQAKPDFQEARNALAHLDSAASRSNLPPIPYSKVAFKSSAWPLYP